MFNLSKLNLLWLFLVTFTWFGGTVQAYWSQEDVAAEIAGTTSVDEAVEIVSDALKRDHFDIVLVVDHMAAAASVGLELRPTKVIFARPPERVERALLRRSKTMGIDLPLKILVFEDDAGNIQLHGNPAGYLADRHDLRFWNLLLGYIDRTNDRLTELETGLISVPSTRSVAETVDAIKNELLATGAFRIPLTLDYAEVLRKSEAILIVFGNPLVGTPLMQETQEVAIDLPQKFLVWEDREGNVHITYNNPFFTAKRHGVMADVTGISNALARFASLGAGE